MLMFFDCWDRSCVFHQKTLVRKYSLTSALGGSISVICRAGRLADLLARAMRTGIGTAR
jgi:hypothetical protein